MDNEKSFLDEVTQLPGKVKLNVYAVLIAKLSNYKTDNIHDKQFIKPVIKELQDLFLNHETSFNVAAFFLKHHLKQHPNISKQLKSFIRHVVETLQDDKFQAYFDKKDFSDVDHECRLPRFFESSLAVHLMQNPSVEMWDSINRVSDTLIELTSKHQDSVYYQSFLKNLGPNPNDPDKSQLPLAFGRFPNKPTLDDVIQTLQEQKDFARIMLIHFMFMRDVYFKFEADEQVINGISRFGYSGDIKQFIAEIGPLNIGQYFYSYSSFSLYKDRGRGPFIDNQSKSLGICIHPEDRDNFPVYETSWCPDSICQQADFSSEYVKLLFNKDIPYVAGPSGMTSLLSASMLFLGKFDSMEEHNYYILAIMSFITGGGLHSIHEVLEVPNVRLGLLKSYKASGKHAGNYNDFFNLFRDNKTIKNNIKSAWSDTTQWIVKHYPGVIPIASYPEPKKADTLSYLFEQVVSIFKG